MESIHHVTPLSNMFLGSQDCNKLKMNHSDHVYLHKICDLDKDQYQSTMDKLYANINNDLLISLHSANQLYLHLYEFFYNYEELPLEIRIELGNKRKQIAMYHLNQWPQITNTDGDSYRKLRRLQIEDWGEIITKNDIEFIMMQDKAIVKDLILHIVRRLKKHGFSEDVLHSQGTTTTGKYMIPLRLRGKNEHTNQLSLKNEIYESLNGYIKSMGGVNTRGARDQTNGKYIFGTEEWKRWHDVQRKYLEKTHTVVNDYYGDGIWNIYLKKMQQLLLHTIDQRNKIKTVMGDTKPYIQRSRSFYGMHEEITKLNGIMGDSLKKVLLDEYCFV